MEDQRRPAQKDRDRILYTSAFRRLAGVTQVAGPHEGEIFHNRLTVRVVADHGWAVVAPVPCVVDEPIGHV